MDECTSIIMNSFHPLQRTLFNKEFVVKVWGGVESLKSEWKRTREGGQAYMWKLTLWKKLPDFSNSK